MNHMDHRFIPSVLCFLVLFLAVTEHFLFREFELVWPFFLLPYIVFSAVSYFLFFRSGKDGLFIIALFQLVIIPVLSGLTMSIGWMIKIDFVGEMIRRIAS